MTIDLRSDTVTKPTKEMKKKMMDAEVGDDVYGEDPSINKLENKAAELFNKEKALFVPSGTMGNQIAINVHTSPGDEVILDKDSHIVNYEMGAISAISGTMPKTIRTDDVYLPIEEVNKAIQGDKYYLSNTSLIAIENTFNAKGGLIYPYQKIRELNEMAKENDLPVHMDGARIFNAAIATGRKVKEITEEINSVMFCLSKGLGAPVGSILVGDTEFISKAKISRKTMGGGMRQAGFLAAAGIYSINNHVKRLKKDHKNAKKLAKSLNESDDVWVKEPDTNILVFDLKDNSISNKELIQELNNRDIKISKIGDDNKLRAVTHLDVTSQDINKAAEIIKKLIDKN